jgi:diguanylate cyclase (GGDEF)-like protein
MLYSSFTVRTGNFVDAGLLFFIFMQGIVLSHKFTHAFSSVERISSQLSLLNSELERKVDERTGELKKAYETIRDISVRDPLTKCYNRRFIDEQLPKEIERAVRYAHPLSVVICDIDFFKAVNDTYGHLAGDKVLIHFSALIESSLRKNIDWCGRYGGEEFLIILPETVTDGAAIIADRIREGCLSLEIPFENNRIRFSASFGVAGLSNKNPADSSVHDSLFHAADLALYRAKREGRNRVVKG